MTMHIEDIDSLPADEAGMWESLKEEFDNAYNIFFETRVESKEQALQKRTGPDEMTYVIAYRGTSVEYDSRNYYLELGTSLLPRIELALNVKKMTPLFLQQWAMMMFCKGFITSYMLDDSNSTSHIVGGMESKALARLRRKWVAKALHPFIETGMSRDDAEVAVAARIKEIIAGQEFRGPFDKDWFEDLLTHGTLKSTFDYKHLSKKSIALLAKESDTDIPSYR